MLDREVYFPLAGYAGPGFHNWLSGHIPQNNGSESAPPHPAPCQNDVRRGVRRRDRGQRPTATAEKKPWLARHFPTSPSALTPSSFLRALDDLQTRSSQNTRILTCRASRAAPQCPPPHSGGGFRPRSKSPVKRTGETLLLVSVAFSTSVECE